MSDYIREIAGYPHGYHPDTPGDGEILAEYRAELRALQDGKGNVPEWSTREACIEEMKKGIAAFEQKVAGHKARRLKIPLDEALKQVRQEGEAK